MNEKEISKKIEEDLSIKCPFNHKLNRKNIVGFNRYTQLPRYFCRKCFAWYYENQLWKYNEGSWS